MKKIKAIVLCMLAMLISIYSLAEASQIEKVVEKSSNLSSFQAKIIMTKFNKKETSNIKFKIKWVYPDKMKIIYLEPE